MPDDDLQDIVQDAACYLYAELRRAMARATGEPVVILPHYLLWDDTDWIYLLAELGADVAPVDWADDEVYCVLLEHGRWRVVYDKHLRPTDKCKALAYAAAIAALAGAEAPLIFGGHDYVTRVRHHAALAFLARALPARAVVDPSGQIVPA